MICRIVVEFGGPGPVWHFLFMRTVWVLGVCIIFTHPTLVNYGKNGKMDLVCGRIMFVRFLYLNLVLDDDY